MGHVYRETFTKPLPEGAELYTRKAEQHARWTDDRGRKRTARVTTGRDGTPRIVRHSGTYTARFRNGANRKVKVSTGCRSKDAALTVLTELEQRADKVRCGAWNAAEDSTLDHQATPIAGHVDAYLGHVKAKRGKGGKRIVSAKHAYNVGLCLRRLVADCGFTRLRELNRRAAERWADAREAEGMSARTINTYLAALTAFGNWLVEANRIVANPFARLPKRDERADRRRERRALTEDELRRLLRVARLRPLAEYGRPIVELPKHKKPTDKKSRRTWKRAPLTFDELDAAAERGRKALRKRPAYIAELQRRGRERALVYKVLALTGLRRGELAALKVRHVDFDRGYIVLDAADEKAGRGAELPLRADLAADLRSWIGEQLDALRAEARAQGDNVPMALPPDTRLLNVPTGLVRILGRDLVAAGIARLVADDNGKQRIDKRDERGRTIDVHALRHSFASHLSRAGVAPRTAQAALRHSTLDLTMQTYTDPKLLDVAGALDALPELPLDDGPEAQRQRATGTDGETVDPVLVPVLVPPTGNQSAPESFAVHTTEDDGLRESAVSVVGDKGKAPQTRDAEKRAIGFEPTTSSLGSCTHRTEPAQSQAVTGDPAGACTRACTDAPESGHSEAPGDDAEAPTGDAFAEAVAMLARLPLTDAERAEAVRRLMAGRQGC